MMDDHDLQETNAWEATARARQLCLELSKVLAGTGSYVVALVPCDRIQGRDCITAVTPTGETLPLTLDMVAALAETQPILGGIYASEIRYIEEELQADLWRSQTATVRELDLVLLLTRGPRGINLGSTITATWGASPTQDDIVLVCGSRPAGWPP